MAYPIIPWIGGKRRLADRIIPLLPGHTCYVEPFAGGAAIFFMKEPSKVEVLNDINGELVNLYRVVKHHLEEFARQFKWALSSREIFRWLQITPAETLTDIQRAARFYYLQKLAFGARVSSQTYGTATTTPPKLNLLRLEEDLSQAHLRLMHAQIERLEWAECVRRYDREHTVFYFDPPYLGTEGYGLDFPVEDYARIAGAVREMKGKAIVSVNDIPQMRKVFAGLPKRQVRIDYNVGGSDRGRDRRELIITNFRP